jgi:hypothetical protein
VVTLPHRLNALNFRRAFPLLRWVDPKTGEKLPIIAPEGWGPTLVEYIDATAADILTSAALPPTADSATALRRGFQIGTEVWYAATIREYVAKLRLALASRNADKILHAAFHLGGLVNEAEVLKRHFATFETGEKTRRALANRRDGWNAKQRKAANIKHQCWIAEAKKIWGRHRRHSITTCARCVIGNLHLTEKQKTVADVIRPHAPKKVGRAS